MRTFALRAAVVGAVACLTLSTPAMALAAPAVHKYEHGLGMRLGHSPKASAAALPVRPLKAGAAVPDSYDLSPYALPPGDQGQVGSCVAWATMHSGYGILMKEQQITGSPMAPMYIYAQIARGNDQGTNGDVALDMAKAQGVDTKAHYWQGPFDYTTQPDASERANAANYKLSGYTTLSTGSRLTAAVKQSIAQGLPVSVGLPVHESFMDVDAQTAGDYSYMPGSNWSDPVAGGHEMAIIAYNSQGVTLQNSWGTNWGNRGFINVSWKFLTTYVDEAFSIGKLVKA